MRCWWCDHSVQIPAMVATVNGAEIALCTDCLWGALHAALKLNRYGLSVFPEKEQENLDFTN